MTADAATTPETTGSPYGPDWGSCADCGGDRELAELDEQGFCMSCSARAQLPKCSECGIIISENDGELCDKCYRRKASEVGQQLTARMSIPELVAVYDRAERDIKAGFALVARAQDSLAAAFTLDSSRGITVQDWRDQVHFDDPEQNLKIVRRSIWQILVDRLELRRLMSISAWEKLEKQLKDGSDVPEVTEITVRAMVEQFTSQLPEMLEAAIGEVFEWLRPHNTDYKRNSQLEIPKRVALTWVVEAQWGDPKRMKVRYNAQPRMTALENVFSALDGRGSITKTHYSALSQAIEKTPRSEQGETEYFRFRSYKNGALHLEFKRLDLLAKFNRIAGGQRLRPKAG